MMTIDIIRTIKAKCPNLYDYEELTYLMFLTHMVSVHEYKKELIKEPILISKDKLNILSVIDLKRSGSRLRNIPPIKPHLIKNETLELIFKSVEYFNKFNLDELKEIIFHERNDTLKHLGHMVLLDDDILNSIIESNTRKLKKIARLKRGSYESY